MHPGIITPFALKVIFPETVGVALTILEILKLRTPTAIEIVAELAAAEIKTVAVEVSVFDPPEFEAVTATFKYLPTSEDVRVYVELVAPEIDV